MNKRARGFQIYADHAHRSNKTFLLFGVYSVRQAINTTLSRPPNKATEHSPLHALQRAHIGRNLTYCIRYACSTASVRDCGWRELYNR